MEKVIAKRSKITTSLKGNPTPTTHNQTTTNAHCTLSTTDRLVVPSNFSAISSTKKLETLVNFIKIKHPATGEREDKERGPKSEPKTQKPKGGLKRGQRTKLCSNTLATSPKKAYHTKKGKGT
jgi:hypothetical protein